MYLSKHFLNDKKYISNAIFTIRYILQANPNIKADEINMLYTQLMNKANNQMGALQKKLTMQKNAEEQERLRKIQEEMERQKRIKEEEERKKKEEEEIRRQ